MTSTFQQQVSSEQANTNEGINGRQETSLVSKLPPFSRIQNVDVRLRGYPKWGKIDCIVPKSCQSAVKIEIRAMGPKMSLSRITSHPARAQMRFIMHEENIYLTNMRISFVYCNTVI